MSILKIVALHLCGPSEQNYELFDSLKYIGRVQDYTANI